MAADRQVVYLLPHSRDALEKNLIPGPQNIGCTVRFQIDEIETQKTGERGSRLAEIPRAGGSIWYFVVEEVVFFIWASSHHKGVGGSGNPFRYDDFRWIAVVREQMHRGVCGIPTHASSGNK